MANHRTGKIARAPADVRKVVNQMLHDGSPYSAIVKFLATKDIEVTEMNVTNWKQGGYEDWLQERAKLEGLQAKREFALEVARQNEGSKVHEAALHIAASQIFDLLEDLDMEQIKALVKTDPENYSRIVGALSRISKEALSFQKYRDMVIQAREVIAPETKLTPDEQRARLREILK